MSYTLFKLLSTGCFQDELVDSNLFSIIGDFIGNPSILYKNVFIEDEYSFNHFDAIRGVYPEYKWIFRIYWLAKDCGNENINEIVGVGINQDGKCKLIIRDEEDLYRPNYKYLIDSFCNFVQDTEDPLEYIAHNKPNYYNLFCNRIKLIKIENKIKIFEYSNSNSNEDNLRIKLFKLFSENEKK